MGWTRRKPFAGGHIHPADVDAVTRGLSESTRMVLRKLLRRDLMERYSSALEL